MPPYAELIRGHLSSGPRAAKQLTELMGVSQPTISRALSGLKEEIVSIGAARSIQYALRDAVRGLPDIPVYRVDAEGRIGCLGTLIPVRPEGFVMWQEDGVTLHSEGLPWWLFDMRPQGYLGRAYAARYGAGLGLPQPGADWSDVHVLRALLTHGHDVVGNLLLGDGVRERFLSTSMPEAICEAQKVAAYAALAEEAAHGGTPGSSAGGKQPKFTAYAATPNGDRHVMVKFSEREAGPVPERWRDLLLAEHLALETLRDAGIPAANSRVLDHGGQRFLEVERFDRVGCLGRRALFSLDALNAEFVGAAVGGWPVVVRDLVKGRQIKAEAAASANLLWAFGTLIGNSDMHGGNLSFMAEHGRPYDMAPAYDMTPMVFAPRSGGGLPDFLPEANISAAVANHTWRRAETLARAFLARIKAVQLSARFGPCIAALEQHIDTAAAKIARLG